jgi:hypothetical protein
MMGNFMHVACAASLTESTTAKNSVRFAGTKPAISATGAASGCLQEKLIQFLLFERKNREDS